MELPSHVSACATATADSGLFTSKDIGPGELIIQIKHPLITILDSARLKQHCEWCLRKGAEDDGANKAEDDVRLRACTGCRIVRYCGKVGQILFLLDCGGFDTEFVFALRP